MDATAFPWDIGFLIDEQQRDTGYAVVRGPCVRKGSFPVFAEVARDHCMIGMTCFGVFPMSGDRFGAFPEAGPPIEGRSRPAVLATEAWAHCFRRPDEFLPEGKPRILYSNSDALDPDWIGAEARRAGPVKEKTWDFIYTCMPNGPNRLRKNWPFASVAALRFAEELGLSGLLVGVDQEPDAPVHPLIELRPPLPYFEFWNCIARSRVFFCPSTWDPSPRVLAQAMCLDVPLVVNEAILGGWKYVNGDTGRFFTGHDDVVEAMATTIEGAGTGAFHPREWFTTHYGPTNAGHRLAAFLNHNVRHRSGLSELEWCLFYSPISRNGALPGPRPA